MSFTGGIIGKIRTLIRSIVMECSRCVFFKRSKIPKNSIIGITLYFYVEKIVFSPQRGKMSFTGGIIGNYNSYIEHCNKAQ